MNKFRYTAQFEVIPTHDVYVRYYSKKYNKSINGHYSSLFHACRDIASFLINKKYPGIGLMFCLELHDRLARYLYFCMGGRSED